jgi:hypothetical protein
MANQNFVVQNGLTVGPLTIDAATGSITTTGTVSVSGLAVSTISKNDSSITINDTGPSGSNVSIVIDGVVEHIIDANGVNLTTGGGYSINGASVLTATTLGAGVVNSSLTSLGTIATLTATTSTITTGITTNFSTGNALITGGAVNNLTTLGATTAVATNFSTGNARITGGYADNFTIGGNTKASGGFTNIVATGVTQITNATNSSGTNYTSGALQVTGGGGFGGDLYVQGNIYAGNLLSTTTQILQVNDPLVYLAASNPGTYNYEIGIYSHFGSGATYQHSGLARDHNDNVWKLFSNVAEPAGGTINFIGATYDTLKAGAVILANTTAATNTTSGALQVGGGAGIAGSLYAVAVYDNAVRVVSTSTGAGNLTISSGAINLTVAGPGAASVGSSTAIPVITTDAYGRVSSTSTAAVIAPAGTLSGATLNATVTASSLTSVGTLTSLSVSGNTAYTSTVYAQGIYDNSNRVLSTTTGAGNLAISGTQVTLSATGPGVASVGSSTAIPVITTDAYGRVSSTSTAAVIAPAGTLSGTTLNSTVVTSSLTSVGTLTNLTVTNTISGSVSGSAGSVAAANITGTTLASGVTASSLTSVGTLTGLTVSGTTTVPSLTHSGTTGTGDIGQSGSTFATVYAVTFSGVSTTAKYADLAENYQGDRAYNPGTVVMFGGSAEVTLADADTTRVAGVVSTNPAHLMNGALNGTNVVALALQGRVPCQVIGPVQKGDILVSAGFGYAKVNNTPQPGTIIGKALQDYAMNAKGVIEVVVGRF